MVDALLALPAALAAFGGAGLLVARSLRDRPTYLMAWCLTLFALGIALSAMTVGFAMGFRPALFRAVALGGSLIAPLALALGVVELVGRSVQARFAARLIAASYVIVAVVIILLDPITGTFGTGFPKVAAHYSSLPQLALAGAHLFAVVSLVACVAVTAVRARGRDRQALDQMLTLALVALAGVLVVAAMRGLLPGPLAPVLLGGSAALVWYGASRLVPGPLFPRRDRDEYDDRDDYDDHDDPEHEYDDNEEDEGMAYGTGPYARPPRPAVPAPRPPQPQPAPGPPPVAPHPGGTVGPCGRIVVYTLLDGHGEAFDRLADEVARHVRGGEPGTIVYTCHAVDNAPAQRIFYQLFRDDAARAQNQAQPYIQRFAAQVRAHVAATNVIEMTLNAGKVIQLRDQPGGGPPAPARGQPPSGAVRWSHG